MAEGPLSAERAQIRCRDEKGQRVLTKLLIAFIFCSVILLWISPPRVAGAHTSVAASSPFLVTRDGDTYHADSQSTSISYTGTLKFVVESAVRELRLGGGGTVNFAAGDFDLGSEHFKLHHLHNIAFQGQGMDVTVIRNSSNATADTEPFNFSGAFGVTVRDLTVAAGGTTRTTSDVLDFDQGNDSLVERVKITASRGRGIVFDGKDAGFTSAGNVVRDCVIDGLPSNGIELLASSNNLIEGCTITNVGRHGIQVNKSSAGAVQPNKKSNDNVIRNNVVDSAGRDGIQINSGDRNQLVGNRVTNSGDSVGSIDGIRISSTDSITCDDNVVEGNVATDNQATKTQRYGLNIASSLCNRTVIADGNDFSGNRVLAINDRGTATHYGQDSVAPSVPTNVAATAVTLARIDLSWSASADNVAIDHYTVRRDGLVLTTVLGSATSYSDTNAQPSTTYSYTVEAVDTSGNASGESAPPVTATTPAVQPLTFTPAADAHVQASNPTTNYGSTTNLRVDGSPLVRSYLRFAVEGVAGTVARARLRVYASTASSKGHDASRVADNTWLETGPASITWSNAPVVGSLIASSGPFGAGTWTEIDVTSYITGNGTYSLALTTPSSTAISYGSRQSANVPQLVVEVS